MKVAKLEETQFQQRQNDEIAILFNEDDFGGKDKLQVVRVFPGGRIRKHKHAMRTEMLQILSGTGQIIVNGQAVADSPGQFVLCEPEEVHEVVNSGEDNLVVAVFRTNEAGDDDVTWLEEV